MSDPFVLCRNDLATFHCSKFLGWVIASSQLEGQLFKGKDSAHFIFLLMPDCEKKSFIFICYIKIECLTIFTFGLEQKETETERSIDRSAFLSLLITLRSSCNSRFTMYNALYRLTILQHERLRNKQVNHK